MLQSYYKSSGSSEVLIIRASCVEDDLVTGLDRLAIFRVGTETPHGFSSDQRMEYFLCCLLLAMLGFVANCG